MTRKKGVRFLASIGIVLWIFLSAAPAEAQKLVYLVRHAERADGGNSSPTAELDPPLSQAGEVRARALAGTFAVAGLSAIYVTEFKRTQQTAAPTAAACRLVPIVIPSRDTARLVTALRTAHPNDIVLIVAHSSTLPGIIRALGGPPVSIDEDDYRSLFVMVPGTGTLSRLRVGP